MKRSFAAVMLALPVLASAAPAVWYVHDVSVDSLWRDEVFRIRVSNQGTETETFWTNLSVEDSTGSVVLEDSFQFVDLAAGDTETIAIPDIGIMPGLHTARCSVALRGDENPENDTASLQFAALLDRDVSADRLWMEATLQALVSNRGSDVVSFYTHVMLYDSSGGLVWTERVAVVGVLPHETRQVDFPIVTHEPGPFPPRCSVAMRGDQNPENDTVSLSVVGGVAEGPGRSVPEPFRVIQTRDGIMVTGPPDMLAGTRLYDAAGRVVAATRRHNGDRLHVFGLRPGVYFVSTEDTRHKLVLAR